MSLFKKPVYVVRYGAINKFELKTLKGCLKRIEKEGIQNYKIYKFTEHLYDPSDDIKELVSEGR